VKKGWFKFLIVVFFLVGFIRISLINLPWIYSSIGPDFTQVWISAKDLLAGKEPYLDPNLGYQNAYPPVSEIFFLPFALLSHQVALVVFTYISFASIIGSVFLSLKIVMKKIPWHYFLLFTGLSFTSFPIRFSLGMGQVNMIVLFLLLLAVYLETKATKNSLIAGLSLGVAIALKPIFAFFLLFFMLKKSWKVVLISSFFVAFLIVTSLVFWPTQIWLSWYQTGILPSVSYKAPYIYVYQNQGIFGFLSRLISNFNARIYLSRAAAVILVPLASYLAYKKKEFNLGLSFFIITLLLLDITSWQHHFVWLMFPFVVLLNYIVKTKNTGLLVLLVISYVLVSWNIKYDYLYPGIILSNQFYGAVILWGINFYFIKIRHIGVPKTRPGSIKYKIFQLLDFE
jgi:alpha-1,2-mannosyltransferase